MWGLLCIFGNVSTWNAKNKSKTLIQPEQDIIIIVHARLRSTTYTKHTLDLVWILAFLLVGKGAAVHEIIHRNCSSGGK